MTTSVALGAIALGVFFWLLSALHLDRYENEFVFSVLFMIGIMLTAAGFFHFLPAQTGSQWQNGAHIVLYIGFILGVNGGLFRWLHR